MTRGFLVGVPLLLLLGACDSAPTVDAGGDVGFLQFASTASAREGLEVLNDGVWRGPFVRHAQHFRPAQPVHHDVTGALDVVRVEEIRLSQSQRQHRPH